jgi:hypothetical protein
MHRAAREQATAGIGAPSGSSGVSRWRPDVALLTIASALE